MKSRSGIRIALEIPLPDRVYAFENKYEQNVLEIIWNVKKKYILSNASCYNYNRKCVKDHVLNILIKPMPP